MRTTAELLDAALILAPVGGLVPAALRATCKGGTVVCGGIHMSDIPSFPYEVLWEERGVRSVANLTRRDEELPPPDFPPDYPIGLDWHSAGVEALSVETAGDAAL